jgi:hypothetical protein
MTSHEGAPFLTPEAEATEHIDFDHILDTYGLGPEEASSEVVFESYRGSVAAMLTNPECPVGAVVARAYKSDGIQGVEAKLEALKGFYGDFDLPIGDNTRNFHEGSVDRATLLTKTPTAREESPDFLDL